MITITTSNSTSVKAFRQDDTRIDDFTLGFSDPHPSNDQQADPYRVSRRTRADGGKRPAVKI
jgi:hypothetical protein